VIDFPALDQALAMLGGSASPWLAIVPGLIIGLVAGAIPGISGSMAMAVLMPITLYMDFLTAVMLLTAVFTGAGFGGAVPAILMKIPGTPSAVATTFDGFPMTEQGRHNEALGIGLISSCLGVMVSYVILLVLVAPLAWAVLKLGPLELLLIAFWGLTLIAALSGKSMARGLIAGIVGVLFGTIGMTDSGYIRGTLDIPLLLDGIPVVPALMGLFVASQLFQTVGDEYIISEAEKRTISFRRILAGIRETFRYPLTLIKGSLVGVFIGIIPGVGASVSNLVSYSDARRSDPDPSSFGKGNPKGVVASESANSSSEGGSMTTLLALGIPGGNATALLLSAFAMHNIIGGPRFIAEQRDLVYAIILGNMAQAALLIVIGIPFVYAASRIVRVPMRYLIPSVMSVAIFGSYALTGNASGPVALLFFAILGWLMTRFDFPVVAAVIGLMLGDLVESELIRSYQISGGDLTYLFERPVAIVFLLLLLVSLATPLFRRLRRRKAAATMSLAEEK
jgi:putative tricarboxylic transport membrane protein